MHNNQVCVFLSHKERDEPAARRIKDELENLSGGMHIHLFEDIPGGTDYREWLNETFRSADLLILLYTDPTEEWDWCLFEAGWFTPLRSENRRPVICLYNPEGDPPKPLGNLEAVKAERRELVSRFLHPLFRTKDFVEVTPLLNEHLTDEKLGQVADRIAAQIGPTQTISRYYLDRIIIEASGKEVAEQGKVPDTAKVTAQDGRLDILELDQAQFSWADFKGRAEETKGPGTFWIEELEAAILRVAEKRPPMVSTATFRGLRGGKIYRALLDRVDRVADEPRKFYVAFNKELEPELVGGPGKMGLAFNLLRLASRFRWEVFEPFSRMLGSPECDVNEVIRAMMESIKAIEDEAKRHEFLNRETAEELFDPALRPEINRMFDRWEAIRQQLAVEVAADRPQAETVKGLLAEIGEMNTGFMAHVATTYATLIEAEATTTA
jgi:hypothetical protein